MNIDEFKVKYNYKTASLVMRQYLDIKFAHLHLDCIILFRMGDFYELFYEDAVSVSKALGIILTKRGKAGEEEIPMCGVPFHALENYLNKLIEAGYKVAICDQLETLENAKERGGYKAIINRGIVRIITPGTITEESLITSNLPNYLASLVIAKNYGSICYVDLGTAEFNILEVAVDQIINQLAVIMPRELLLSENYRGSELANNIKAQLNICIAYQADNFFAYDKSAETILAFYNIASFKAIGELSNLQISSLGGILEYINVTQKQHSVNLAFPKIITSENYMLIDSATRRNLEITKSLNNTAKGSLLNTIDYTTTKAGSRLLYKFLCKPLLDITHINNRLAYTDFFYNNFSLTENIRKLLAKTQDLERCVAQLNMKRGSFRHLLGIKHTLKAALDIKSLFADKFGLNTPNILKQMIPILSSNEQIIELIEESIKEDTQGTLSDGGFIKVGYHPKVKELYDLINNRKSLIEPLRIRYQNEMNIDSLKISHNNILGLFIEISSKNASKIIRDQFIHRQTTANTVRYTTKELQDLESEIVNAKNLVINLEQELYQQICTQVVRETASLILLADILSQIDVFCNFAYIAARFSYCKPTLTNDRCFNVLNGRHLVIEQESFCEQSFITNNCILSEDQRIWLLTGPNMAGKSTFLRQNALIAILAQVGSFIPASCAKIGIVDKIFSRIGAGDDLLKGASTFMVEMLEVSAILSQSTERSLIILDEVGRGTATYDGIAIAWSVLEHIHNNIKCRCLFATHYFELTILSNLLLGLTNYTVEVQEKGGNIVFLHKIIPGFASKSYGIHVARLAGLPKPVISRASEVLLKLEQKINNI